MPDIAIKIDEFVYPSCEELQKIRPDTPRLQPFGFPYVHEIVALFDGVGNMQDVARRSNLHWWDHCLVNRIGSLSHAYTTALVNYNRGLPDEVKAYRHEHFVNRAQFGFYGESYFYFFMSVRDTIVQLINIYYGMGIAEDKLRISKELIKKIPNQQVGNLFTHFLADSELTSDYRNGLAHRFLLTQPDHRPTIHYDQGNMVYEAGAEKEITSSHLLAEIKRSMLCMSQFLDDLKLHIYPSTFIS